MGKVGDSPLPKPLARDLARLAEMERPDPHRPGRLATFEPPEVSARLTRRGIRHLVRAHVRTIHQDFGALMVGKEEPWELGSRERFVLTTLANQAAVALENARLRREIEEGAQRLRALIQASPLAIIARDRDANIQMWNPAAAKMFGWTEEEVLGGGLYPLVPEDRRKEFQENLGRSQRGEALSGLETRRQKKDGTPIEVGIWTAPLHDGGAMVLIADITERKRAEEALRELAVVEERNRIARDIHDSLAQEFMAIIWQLNAAERSLQNGKEETLQYMERVRGLARKGIQEARRSVWDLRAGPLGGHTIEEALKQEVEKMGGGSDIRLHFNASGEQRPLPSGVEAALLRICQESLANVMKYARASKVTVDLAYGESEARLTVKDNGTGFDPDMPRPRKKGGGGFGLISMRERARLLGGELRVESKPDRGTVIKATLPLK